MASKNEGDDEWSRRAAYGIREKILAGTLPKENLPHERVGPGTGQICVACERPIAADDVEVERDLPDAGLHRRCYDIWAAEWPRCESA